MRKVCGVLADLPQATQVVSVIEYPYRRLGKCPQYMNVKLICYYVNYCLHLNQNIYYSL